MLPPDGHVHTEWSWDAVAGSMQRSCERAVQLGLASIAFTEHADFTRWVIEPAVRAGMHGASAAWIGPDGRFNPPPLDPAAYLDCVRRCRDQFPDLRILAGLELGEPHWHEDRVKDLLGLGEFDRLLGSVHSLALDGPWAVDHLFDRLEPGDLMRAYLSEALRLVDSPAPFAVLAHVDYPVRHWPARPAASMPPFSRTSTAPCWPRWPGPAACSRSTRWCRSRPSSCGGGMRPAAAR